MKEKFQNPQTVIRWLFAGFTVICLLAAVLVSDRSGMLDGLVRICTQSGQTVKSYFDPSYGGFSGTFLNVALVCAVCLGLYCLPGSKPDGVSVLAFFLTAGFCFWGTTILNIWFSFAGVLIYCLVMKKKPGAMANAFLFSTGLAPLITEMLFNYPTLDAASASGFTLHGILLALAVGIFIGFSPQAGSAGSRTPFWTRLSTRSSPCAWAAARFRTSASSIRRSTAPAWNAWKSCSEDSASDG